MPKGSPKVDQTAAAITKLVEAIGLLEVEVKSMKDSLKKEPVKIETPTDAPSPVMTPTKQEMPFPLEWRQAIDDTLNRKFEAAVNYLENGKFELTINVPKEYSNANAREWEMNHADRRIKIIENHLGAAGVRDFCELIAKNLGDEMRAKIKADQLTFA